MGWLVHMPRCCVQGDKVKKGQALGYVEQLGTHFPVEVRRALRMGRGGGHTVSCCIHRDGDSSWASRP